MSTEQRAEDMITYPDVLKPIYCKSEYVNPESYLPSLD